MKKFWNYLTYAGKGFVILHILCFGMCMGGYPTIGGAVLLSALFGFLLFHWIKREYEVRRIFRKDMRNIHMWRNRIQEYAKYKSKGAHAYYKCFYGSKEKELEMLKEVNTADAQMNEYLNMLNVMQQRIHEMTAIREELYRKVNDLQTKKVELYAQIKEYQFNTTNKQEGVEN